MAVVAMVLVVHRCAAAVTRCDGNATSRGERAMMLSRVYILCALMIRALVCSCDVQLG